MQFPAMLDRDESILAFNTRVLDWAAREEVPLLERMRYLSIVSSNLDEFFEVRMADLLDAAQNHIHEGDFTERQFLSVSARAHELVAQQYDILRYSLYPALAANGITIVSHGERTPEQRRWVKHYFETQVRPLLLPVSLDPAHPFPQVANKSLNFIVKLAGQDALGRSNSIAILKVPRALPRLLRLPPHLSDGKDQLVSLPSVIRAHLEELFPNREVEQLSQFRVTRHSDLAVDEEDVSNLRMALREGLQQRHYGKAVRVEVSSNCPDELAELLCRQFDLPPQSLYRVHGPVNLVRMSLLVDLVNKSEFLFPPFAPAYPQALRGVDSIFERLKQGDVLAHQPFESFDPVLDMLREAVNDPNVLAIKQTIYRTGSDSELMLLLRDAIRRGKEVTAVVELKARFDEEANINWAEKLESVGAQVVYGVVGMKTHAKMLLITRREGKKLKRYGHLATGNYNPRTARLYTDLSYFTADDVLTGDMQRVFVHLASQSEIPRLSRMLMAPYTLQDTMLQRIAQAGRAAAAGKGGRIVAKMNALTDEALILALLEAGQKGARIDLIVRGACMLHAQVPGLSENIRVRSIIGRFLEHSRVFYFGIGEEEHLYLSSADWMNRNMLRRIELAWPVTDPELKTRIIDECLLAYEYDEALSWQMQADGSYARPPSPLDHPRNVQRALMTRYLGAGKGAGKKGRKKAGNP
ncbi:MAG: polyphosphate kinase 1 [Brachymonas denitrificans]|uniref:polyphosphate kinase 1 n=1 Tax=Brachymonas denitrificans TaxID=28220 RepID=UPI001BD00DD3|nr:polyphosphate kinase 1 [Brachymonas denitrificans]